MVHPVKVLRMRVMMPMLLLLLLLLLLLVIIISGSGWHLLRRGTIRPLGIVSLVCLVIKLKSKLTWEHVETWQNMYVVCRPNKSRCVNLLCMIGQTTAGLTNHHTERVKMAGQRFWELCCSSSFPLLPAYACIVPATWSPLFFQTLFSYQCHDDNVWSSVIAGQGGINDVTPSVWNFQG